MGKIKMSKTVPAETNHLRGDRESPGDGKNKIRVNCVVKLPHKASVKLTTFARKIKSYLGKVCIFLPILFKGKLIHYICVIPILLCCYHTFHLGLKFEFKHSL